MFSFVSVAFYFLFVLNFKNVFPFKSKSLNIKWKTLRIHTRKERAKTHEIAFQMPYFYSNCALQMRYFFILTAGWNFVTSVTIKTGLACVGNSCKFNKNRLRSSELSNWYNFSRPFNLGEKVLSDCVWSNKIYLPPKFELWAWTKGNEWLVVCGYWWMVD